MPDKLPITPYNLCTAPSFPRMRESSAWRWSWMPACAGMTRLLLHTLCAFAEAWPDTEFVQQAVAQIFSNHNRKEIA